MRRRNGLILIFIIAVSALAGVFIYPVFDAQYQFRPWRLGLDLVGGSHLEYQIDLSGVPAADRESVVNGLRDVIEKRVNLFGVSEPQVFSARAGDQRRLVVELAGIKDTAEAKKQIGAIPFLSFAEVDLSDSQRPRFTPTALTGKYVTGAQLEFDQTTSQSRVAISFNGEGAKIFEDLTVRNIKKPIAVFLDNLLIEMPVVQEKISGGRAQITGSFSIPEAQQLVARFNAGALPAPITLVNEQTVGASLGNDSLRRTIAAGAAGALAVILFMCVYYRWYGAAASLALILYILLTLALYKLLGVTMTLAGVAGFILSIGMAVDANILIFERRREEAKKGLSSASAVEEGFRRAWPSIRDSNVSTMITALILYYFTTGFVRGFALTLLLGVVMSMFSAITITRKILQTSIS